MLLLVSRQRSLYPSWECTYTLLNKLLLFKTVSSLSLDWIFSFKKTRIWETQRVLSVTTVKETQWRKAGQDEVQQEAEYTIQQCSPAKKMRNWTGATRCCGPYLPTTQAGFPGPKPSSPQPSWNKALGK